MNTSIKEILKKVRRCYQCGTCAGGCPIFQVDHEHNPRLLIEKMLLSDNPEELLMDDRIWYCSLCYSCTARCPQGVDLAHVLVELKNHAVTMKKVPDSIQKELKAIIETGRTVEASQAVLSRRKRLGLPILPQIDQEEILKLFEGTGALEAIVAEATD